MVVTVVGVCEGQMDGAPSGRVPLQSVLKSTEESVKCIFSQVLC